MRTFDKQMVRVVVAVLLASACDSEKTVIAGMSLKADRVDLKPGEEVKIVPAFEGQLRGTRVYEAFSSYEIVSGTEGGTLAAVSGPGTIFRARGTLYDIVTVVIRGVSLYDTSQSTLLTLTVTPDVVKSVEVTSSSPAVDSAEPVTLSASVKGLGVYSKDVTWVIASGGGVLSEATANTVRYSAGGLADGTEVEIAAVSATTPTVAGRLKLKVVKKPVIERFEALPLGVPAGRAVLPIGGGKAKLSWVVKEAQSVEIAPMPGVVTGDSVELPVAATTEFVLTAKNGPWVVSKSVVMGVEKVGVLPGAGVGGLIDARTEEMKT